MTIRAKRVRVLRVEKPSAAGRGAFISAASGLVIAGNWMYVIADDELHLGVFPATGNRRGSLVRLLPGQLPGKSRRRKARKPDFEVLAAVPAAAAWPHGALLALGSGSRPNRRKGVLLPVDGSGAVSGAAVVIDMSEFYRALLDRLGELNVEGAAVIGTQLCLLSRGHPRRGGSAIIRLSWRSVQRAIIRGSVEALPCKVRRYDLGQADDVPLGFTDAAALRDGSLVFSAVAENASDSYEDGPCLASALGVIDPTGNIAWIRRLSPAYKVEGIAVRQTGRRHELLLVTDADDSRVEAVVYRTPLPRAREDA